MPVILNKMNIGVVSVIVLSVGFFLGRLFPKNASIEAQTKPLPAVSTAPSDWIAYEHDGYHLFYPASWKLTEIAGLDEVDISPSDEKPMMSAFTIGPDSRDWPTIVTVMNGSTLSARVQQEMFDGWNALQIDWPWQTMYIVQDKSQTYDVSAESDQAPARLIAQSVRFDDSLVP